MALCLFAVDARMCICWKRNINSLGKRKLMEAIISVNQIMLWLQSNLKHSAVTASVIYKAAKTDMIPNFKLLIASWHLGVIKYYDSGQWWWKLR